MSETVIQVPAHIQARIDARKAGDKRSSVTAAVVSDAFAFPKISTRSSRFRLVESGVETVVGITLDVVIVGASPYTSKVFYSKPFSGDLNVRPDCFSADGIRPDNSVQEPVSNSCQTCPHNVLGSKVNPSGAKTKMCADQRHLAVVSAADPTKIYELTVPVSGMKAMREYFKHLENYGLAPEEVITQLSFDEAANFPKLQFAHTGYLSAKATAAVDIISESEEVKEVLRLIPPSNRLAAPAQQAAQAAPQAPAQQAAQSPMAHQGTLETAKPPAPQAEDEGYDDDPGGATATETVAAQAAAEAQAPAQAAAASVKSQRVKPAAATEPGQKVQALETALDDIFGKE